MDLGNEDFGDLIDYPNVPPMIGMAISGRPELLVALNTVLSVEDLHDILEVIAVDAHNRRILRKKDEDK